MKVQAGGAVLFACSAKFICGMWLPCQPIMFTCFSSVAFWRRASHIPHTVKIFEVLEGFGCLLPSVQFQ